MTRTSRLLGVRERDLAKQGSHSKQASEARRLLSAVEKSQVPFGESAGIFAGLKAKIEKDQPLTGEEMDQLRRLVKIARDWEKGEESSAMTEPEETLAG